MIESGLSGLGGQNRIFLDKKTRGNPLNPLDLRSISRRMRNALFGLVCLDVYADTGVIRPGCGILHNAYHLQQLGCGSLHWSRHQRSPQRPIPRFLAPQSNSDITQKFDRRRRIGHYHHSLSAVRRDKILNIGRVCQDDFRLTAAGVAQQRRTLAHSHRPRRHSRSDPSASNRKTGQHIGLRRLPHAGPSQRCRVR